MKLPIPQILTGIKVAGYCAIIITIVAITSAVLPLAVAALCLYFSKDIYYALRRKSNEKENNTDEHEEHYNNTDTYTNRGRSNKQ